MSGKQGELLERPKRKMRGQLMHVSDAGYGGSARGMIKWRHPSSAPNDTSWFCGITTHGVLEGWTFDRENNRWRVFAIPGFGERLCETTSGIVGWALWSEVFDHIRATSHSNGERADG